MKKSLSIPEELLLLALRDEKGTIVPGVQYGFAIGGAILAELLMARRIRIDDSKKRSLVDAVDESPLGDPLLDDALAKIVSARRRGSMQTWVNRFANTADLKHTVARGLCDRGILREEEGRVLFIFSRTLYPESDPGPEQELLDRLKEAVFGDSAEVDARTSVLVALAHHSGLLAVPFPRKELKARKKRIEQLAAGDLTAKATRQAIEAMQAAIVAAAVVSSVVATTVVTSS